MVCYFKIPIFREVKVNFKVKINKLEAVKGSRGNGMFRRN